MIYTVEQIREMVTPVVSKYPVKTLYLFGSYARGMATEYSDIDLLADSDGVLLEGLQLCALAGELNDIIPKEVQIVDLHCVKKPSGFFDSVWKTKVVLYVK
jgi:hypothetical protein